MRVLKFGGTSVGSPERMQAVAAIINDGHRKIVVLSAVTGTTNVLVEIGDKLAEGNKVGAVAVIENLYEHYKKFIATLYKSESSLEKGKAVIDKQFAVIRSLIDVPTTVIEQRILVAQGELISTQLFHHFLTEMGRKSVLLPALEMVKIDDDNEPILSFIEEKLTALLAQYSDCDLFITQGYICRNPKGEIDNLKRGGSDYTGTLLGAAINAEEIQIWTDIDGMHNNDPRIVKRTFPVREVSFNEAAELAYFGAKILHPTCIRPAQDRNVPVKLLNTMEPSAEGTVITNNVSDRAVTAIAAKDNITVIKIKSTRMLLAHGFLRKVFEVFEKYKTPIDVITTSEVALSMTIDETSNLEAILVELEQYGVVEVEQEQSIICIVGNFSPEKSGIVLNLLTCLKDIPFRMISSGGSKYNTTIVLKTIYKVEALNALNEGLFEWK
jgi:aspartate kinase